jgi:hypothetical protein
MLTMEVIEIKLHLDTNREGFSLSRSWRPLTWILQEEKKTLSKEK